MTRFFSWLSNVHTPLFVGILWAAGCLWNVSFNELIKVISPTSLSGENFDPSQSVFDFVSVILVAPLIETALFQALPYYLLNKIDFFRKRIWLIILVSSIIFSLLHIYSILYVLFAFFRSSPYDRISFKAREAPICYDFHGAFDDKCDSSCVRTNLYT